MKENKTKMKAMGEDNSRSWAWIIFILIVFFVSLAFAVKPSNETSSYFEATGDMTGQIKVKGVQLKIYQDTGEGYKDVTKDGFDLDTNYFVTDRSYNYDMIIKNDDKATVKAEEYYLRWWFSANIDGTEYDITDYCSVDTAFVYKQDDSDGKTRFYSVNGLDSNVIAVQTQLTFLSKIKFKGEYDSKTDFYGSILDKEASGSKIKITAHIEGSLEPYEILKPAVRFYDVDGSVFYYEETEFDSYELTIPHEIPTASIIQDGETLAFQGWIKNGVGSTIYTPNEEVEVEANDVFTPYYAKDADYSDFVFTIDSVTGEYIIAGANKSMTTATIPSLYKGQVVSVIKSNAFNSYSSLQTVELPQTITKIGNFAFAYCSNLKTIIIPDSVTNIEKYAFYSCTSLTSVEIPETLTTIADHAFAYSGLESIDLKNVQSIESSAFSGCDNLTSINIPATTSNIASGAFGYTKKLETITVDAGSQYYVAENNILYNKNKTVLVKAGINVKNPTIPTTVKTINVRAFYLNKSTTFDFHEGLETLENSAFENSSLKTIHLPSSVKTIATSALYINTGVTITLGSDNKNFVIENGVLYDINKTRIIKCADPQITSFVMPSSVTQLDIAAFHGCTILESITLNNIIKEIPIQSFYCCYSLTGNITIPDNIKRIGGRAFTHTALTSITFENTSGWYVTTSAAYSGGSAIDVTNVTTNASNLTEGEWYPKNLYRK